MQEPRELPEGRGIMVITLLIIIVFLYVLIRVSYKIGYMNGSHQKTEKYEVPGITY